jgi:hypothetical protein
MFGILDKEQPVVVSREQKYHSQGEGACEDSWGFYGEGPTLKEAKHEGCRACEKCSFEELTAAKLLRRFLPR